MYLSEIERDNKDKRLQETGCESKQVVEGEYDQTRYLQCFHT